VSPGSFLLQQALGLATFTIVLCVTLRGWTRSIAGWGRAVLSAGVTSLAAALIAVFAWLAVG